MCLRVSPAPSAAWGFADPIRRRGGSLPVQGDSRLLSPGPRPPSLHHRAGRGARAESDGACAALGLRRRGGGPRVRRSSPSLGGQPGALGPALPARCRRRAIKVSRRSSDVTAS